MTNQDQAMSGFSLPLVLQGEAMNSYAPDADEFRSLQPGKDTIRDFSTVASYSVNGNPILDQFVEGIPLSGLSVATLPGARCNNMENPNNFSTSSPFEYPLECPRNIVPSDYTNVMNSSCGTMNYEFNDLPFDTSSRWDFSKSLTSPELVGTVIPRPTGNSTSNGWILPERGSLTTNSPGSCLFSNELSLSLATSRPSVINRTSVQEPCLEMSSSGINSYSLHQRRHIGSEQTSCNSNNVSLSFNSSKPVEISHLLLGSSYFHVMQEILAEIACFALENFDQMNYSTTGIEDRKDISFALAGRCYSASTPPGYPDGDCLIMDRGNHILQDLEVETKKKHLLALLQVVDDRFNQCLDEIHTAVSAFHAVTELDPNILARFALPTISFMYKNLRDRISCHILAMGANFSDGREKEEKSFEASFIDKQWALQQLRKRDHPLWRPQRGLPERSVSVLRAWMFQNFLHPYPKDAEKHLLALKSGLTRSQVSNWFINARVRLWKPMIEEMYAEMNRRKGRRNNEGTDSNYRNRMVFENTRFMMN
ncbi:homeobox ATH1-like [Olea europaea subsp. europaea]|uniref:Homeobox ATH1-like n=2 Tax=Olea europaea subsp. europaea TaxID=158383 RepID=A0A8S0RBK5_OLEEU|nr:homeobox ATH1-like [Olea europaea subsp. europaea]